MALELAFLLALSGKGGELRLQEEILAALPPLEGSHSLSVAGAMQNLDRISHSQLSKYCSKSAQGLIGVTKELLQLMSLGRAPSVEKLSKDGCMHALVQRLPRLCKTVGVKNRKEEELYGTDALSHMLTQLTSRKTSSPLDLEMVTPFVVYRWILPESLKASVDTLVAEAVKACGSQTRSAPAASSGSDAPPSKKLKKAALKDEVSDLFA